MFSDGFNGFNFNDENNDCDCQECTCGNHQQVDYLETDIDFVDPEQLIDEYVFALKQARNEGDLYNILCSFWEDVSNDATKNTLFEQAKQCMHIINIIQNEKQ